MPSPRIDDQAYRALDAIRRGDQAALATCETWIDAFKTMRWVVTTQAGLTLTPSGLRAFDDMAASKTKPGDPQAQGED